MITELRHQTQDLTVVNRIARTASESEHVRRVLTLSARSFRNRCPEAAVMLHTSFMHEPNGVLPARRFSLINEQRPNRSPCTRGTEL
jgi:hypothetical protein